MRINLEKFPFSRVLFTYCIGYYDKNDHPCFMTDANIINVAYKNNNLAFDLYSNLKEKFKEINDFTIAPLMTAVNEKGEIYVRILKEKEREGGLTLDAGMSVYAGNTNECHAPFWTLVPMAMDCRKMSVEGEYSPTCRAAVMDFHVSDCLLNEQNALDMVKIWENTEWQCVGQSENA